MKFKVTLRNKFNAEITNEVIEADTEQDAKDEYSTEATQVLSVRPLREIGSKPEKANKPVYIRTQTLRNRKERDLSNKQMSLGKYSPEAIQKEQEKLRQELNEELGQ
jgi:hypothetical protein